MIKIQDFQNIEIKIGTIKSVDYIDGADKLLKFTIDLGTEERQILSGIRPYYLNPEELIGKQVPVLVNLEPKTFRGETSFGMILMADGEEGPVLLHPLKEVKPGTIVR